MIDLTRLDSVVFRPRAERIPVPDLAEWWAPEDDELGGEGTEDGKDKKKPEPFWEVRGLDGNEIAHVNYIVSEEGQKRIEALTKAIAESMSSGLKPAIQNALQIGKAPTEDSTRRAHMLVYGSVSPVIGLPMANKIRQFMYPTFLQLTNKIINLSYLGYEPGK